ncbi:hypothetical protein ACIGHB_23145 [Streptomyces sp. NPDC085460]|uniref:hypothetical protein n=1 Tax=Streptomyces sp. NPDC085460 TaxID=3365723 RepID=UPI0037D5BE38
MSVSRTSKRLAAAALVTVLGLGSTSALGTVAGTTLAGAGWDTAPTVTLAGAGWDSALVDPSTNGAGWD